MYGQTKLRRDWRDYTEMRRAKKKRGGHGQKTWENRYLISLWNQPMRNTAMTSFNSDIWEKI